MSATTIASCVTVGPPEGIVQLMVGLSGLVAVTVMLGTNGIGVTPTRELVVASWTVPELNVGVLET